MEENKPLFTKQEAKPKRKIKKFLRKSTRFR